MANGAEAPPSLGAPSPSPSRRSGVQCPPAPGCPNPWPTAPRRLKSPGWAQPAKLVSPEGGEASRDGAVTRRPSYRPLHCPGAVILTHSQGTDGRARRGEPPRAGERAGSLSGSCTLPGCPPSESRRGSWGHWEPRGSGFGDRGELRATRQPRGRRPAADRGRAGAGSPARDEAAGSPRALRCARGDPS